MSIYEVINFGSKGFETQWSRKNVIGDLYTINIEMFPKKSGNVL